MVTDHRPLLGIFNDRELGSIKNPRTRRIKEHTLDYSFNIKYCPGKLHVGADALSRHPTEHQSDDATDKISEICEDSIEARVHEILASIDNTEVTLSVLTLDKVEVSALKDTDYIQLLELVQSGFPGNRSSTPSCCKAYWPLAQKGTLTTFGNTVMYEDRIVIPSALRSHVLRVLH